MEMRGDGFEVFGFMCEKKSYRLRFSVEGDRDEGVWNFCVRERLLMLGERLFS